MMISNTTNKYDFGRNQTGSDWMVIVDGVMGGLSTGDAYLKDESIYFEGVVSLENNGGFSSLRAPFVSTDLSETKTIEIRYRSTGISCALSLDLSNRWWETNFKLALSNTNDEWKTERFSIEELKAYKMGKPKGYSISKEDLAEVMRIGFITNEKRAGAFSLEVDYLHFLP